MQNVNWVIVHALYTHVYKAGIDVLVLFGASHELGSMCIICGV